MKFIFTSLSALFILLTFSVEQGIAQNTPPTANCKGNTIVTPIFNGESRVIHANTFDQNSYDSETSSNNLKFAFSEDPADSVMVIDCSSIGSMDITMYVFDEEGDFDFCNARFKVDDQCDSNPMINGTTDTIAPTIFLIDEIALLTLDSVTFSTIEARDFNAGTYDDQSSLGNLKFSFSEDVEDNTFSYHCYDYPGFDLTIYVTDEAGNQSYSRTSFSIDTSNCQDGFILDSVPPVALCISSLEIDLDAEGIAIISAADIDDGSYDGDGITPDDRLIFSFSGVNNGVSELIVDCEDKGASERKIFVWDYAGNVDSCSFTLTVNDPLEFCIEETVDTIPPIARCIPLLDIEFEADTLYTLNAVQLDNGSTDNETEAGNLHFSFSTDTLDTEMILTCEDLGNNQVTLFVTDKEGNSATCTSVISLLDPEDLCAPEDTTTSVTNLNEVQWNIYPNPFSKSLTIENLPIENGQIHLVLYDLRGQKLLNQDITNREIRIYPELDAGTYFLKLTQNGEVIGVHKISKN